MSATEIQMFEFYESKFLLTTALDLGVDVWSSFTHFFLQEHKANHHNKHTCNTAVAIMMQKIFLLTLFSLLLLVVSSSETRSLKKKSMSMKSKGHKSKSMKMKKGGDEKKMDKGDDKKKKVRGTNLFPLTLLSRSRPNESSDHL